MRTIMHRVIVAAAVALLAVPAHFAAQTPAASNQTLTAVEGLKVGHVTLTERLTGCTVIVVDGDAVGGVSRRGAMKSGLGSAAIRLPNGLIVAAIVAVNAVGDIIDPATGRVVAGVRNADDSFADARRILRTGSTFDRPRAGENTTIGVVATN